MNIELAASTIKATVDTFLPGSKVLLFGSRARASNGETSDYDLLIITSETLDVRTKMNWENKIRKALVSAFKLPFDILIQSKMEVSEKMNLTGHIVREAMKDAVEL